jgi:hypothetical protein
MGGARERQRNVIRTCVKGLGPNDSRHLPKNSPIGAGPERV